MGRDLHYSIIPFFVGLVTKHTRVSAIEELSDDENVVFRIDRAGGFQSVTVHLSDAYSYGEYDYISRPPLIKRGDFILVAKPEGSFGAGDVARATQDSIGLGKIGKLMGALHRPEVWKYETPEERERKKQDRGRRNG